MNNIVVALPNYEDKYETLVSELEVDFIISENAESQERAIDLLNTMKPQYFLLEKNLPGTRDYDDFCKLLVEKFNDVTIIVWNDNLEEIISMLFGEIEIPVFKLDELFMNNTDQDDVIYEDFKNEEENYKKVQSLWKRITEADVQIDGLAKKAVAVAGFSGGIGKTDIAINLAARASFNGFKTCLLGFDLQNCNLEERLGIERKRGKGLVAAHYLYLANQLSVDALKGCMYTVSGIDVLIGPDVPEDSEEMDEKYFIELIELLREHYDLIVIDTENNAYSPSYLPVLMKVDYVLVPCTTHVSHLQAIQKGLKNWKDNYDFPLSKVDIVLNKSGEGGVLNKEIIDKNLSRECISEIPYTKMMIYAAESETPLVLKKGAVPIHKSFDKLLVRFLGKASKSDENIKKSPFRLLKEVIAYAKFVSPFGRSS
jgi:pilus assembly protein CpaE